MAESLSPLTLRSGLSVFRETVFDATANTSMFTAAATSLQVLSITNPSTAASSYAKFYNTASPTVGTTAPDMVLPVVSGKTLSLAIASNLNAGFVFATAMSGACVTAGGTGGVTSPAASVTAAIAASI